MKKKIIIEMYYFWLYFYIMIVYLHQDIKG